MTAYRNSFHTRADLHSIIKKLYVHALGKIAFAALILVTLNIYHGVFKEPLIDSAAHLRHIFSRLLLAEKPDVHPVHLAFFAIADEKTAPNLYHLIKSAFP